MHPFREMKVATYERVDGDGPEYISMIGRPGETSVTFTGDTQSEAFQKADDFRKQAIEDNEAAMIARKAATEKARKTKQKG